MEEHWFSRCTAFCVCFYSFYSPLTTTDGEYQPICYLNSLRFFIPNIKRQKILHLDNSNGVGYCLSKLTILYGLKCYDGKFKLCGRVQISCGGNTTRALVSKAEFT